MPRKRSSGAKRRLVIGTVLVAISVSALTLALINFVLAAPTASAPAQTALDADVIPEGSSTSDTIAVELGLKFVPSIDGVVDAVRYYKSPSTTGTHTGSLWTSSGTLLSQATFDDESASGWQTAKLPEPVRVDAGQTYVVSYHAAAGSYSAEPDFFSSPTTRGAITLPAAAGVYSYGTNAFPTQTWKNSNYFVDLSFIPSAREPGRTLAEKPSEPTKRGTTRAIDGGPDYFGGFTESLPSDPRYFPIGVWYEGVLERSHVALDRAAGLNLYVELTADSDTSLLGPNGPYAITSGDMPNVAGRITTDEADMWGGPGSAEWTGNYPGQGPICSPENSSCGYTIMDSMLQGIDPDSLTYTNYGKGVTFWESDDEAARFVNQYQDVVSADNYWFTDPNICGASEGGQMFEGNDLPEAECRLAANYGWTIDRLRSLVQPAGSKPVWAFVEVGHPTDVDVAPSITGQQIRAAVWSSIIHGARGVVYFNHSFGGNCISHHVLRDVCGAPVRGTVTSLNKQITKLAPVLNAPFLDGVTKSTGAVDHMTKVHEGRVYIFAASAQALSQTSRITNNCLDDQTVSVVGENRTIPVSDGRFVDEFTDGNAVHIYSATSSPECQR